MKDEPDVTDNRYSTRQKTSAVSNDQLADAFLQLAAQVDHLSARLQKSEAKITSITRLESALSAHLSALNRDAANTSTRQVPPPGVPRHLPSRAANPQQRATGAAVEPLANTRVNLGHPDTMRPPPPPRQTASNAEAYPDERPRARPKRRRPASRNSRRGGITISTVLIPLGLIVALGVAGYLTFTYRSEIGSIFTSAKKSGKALPTATKTDQNASSPGTKSAPMEKTNNAAIAQQEEGSIPLPPAPDSVSETKQQQTTTLLTPAASQSNQSPDDLPTGVFQPGLRKAALSGHPLAQYAVARQFQEGIGVEKDYKRSSIWLAKSAAGNYPPALYRLASNYEHGRGVEKNLQRAFELYRSAAERGHMFAMYNLGVFYLTGAAGTKDPTQSYNWFEQAAQLGLTNAQFNLARLYETGTGVDPNLNKALHWYYQASKQGDKEAQKQVDAISKRVNPTDFKASIKRADAWGPTPPNYAANGLKPPNGATPTTTATSQQTAVQDRFEVTSDKILEVQKILSATGYLGGTADGVMGPNTQQAIMKFQEDRGLPANGQIYKEFYDTLKAQPG